MKKAEKILIFLGVLGLLGLFFVSPVFAQTKTEIQPAELEIKAPTILPISGIYPIKEFFRKVRLVFTFSPLKKAELRLKFANEKLMETKEIAKTASPELVEKSLANYQEESEKTKVEAEKLKKEDKMKFLEKYIAHALKQQMVLENIASQVKGEVYEKILANREKHLERFKEVMEKVENKEKLKEEIQQTINEITAVAPERVIKIYETIKEIEEKVPEEIKSEIKEMKKEIVSRATQAIMALPTETRPVEIKEEIKVLANPLVAQEIIEEIGKTASEIALIPEITTLSTEILQEKLAPLSEVKQVEVLEKITGEKIRHLEKLQEVKEKLEALPTSVVAPRVIEKAIKKQLEKLEIKIESIKTLPTASATIEKIKEELKEAPRIKEEIIKQAPSLLKIKELEIKSTQIVPKLEEKTGFCGWSTNVSCQTDNDCLKGGCSGHVCYGKNEEPIVTTCEWRDCYKAEIYGVRCGCFNSKCQWGK